MWCLPCRTQRRDVSSILNAAGRDTIIRWNGRGLTSIAWLLHDKSARIEKRRISEVYQKKSPKGSTSFFVYISVCFVITDQNSHYLIRVLILQTLETVNIVCMLMTLSNFTKRQILKKNQKNLCSGIIKYVEKTVSFFFAMKIYISLK